MWSCEECRIAMLKRSWFWLNGSWEDRRDSVIENKSMDPAVKPHIMDSMRGRGYWGSDRILATHHVIRSETRYVKDWTLGFVESFLQSGPGLYRGTIGCVFSRAGWRESRRP